jgi:hypothetical protein
MSNLFGGEEMEDEEGIGLHSQGNISPLSSPFKTLVA